MYAPVLIHTLNRIKHLKRCVESIASNKEACNTQLYISVDYPPSEKYEKGYAEVKEYVKSITGFGRVNLFFQERNLGPGGNGRFLRQEASRIHDCFIATEDDNEFSKDFLSYMNWGLDEFKNDKKIFAICAKSDFPLIMGTNKADYIRFPAYNAYGVGHWYDKTYACIDYLKNKNVDEIYRNRMLRKKIYNNSPMLYYYLAQDSLRNENAMRSSEDTLTYIDIWRNIYCIENDLECIIPIKDKSRNWGADGSGIHADMNESADYIPPTVFDTDPNWPDVPICLPDSEKNFNYCSRSDKFAISKRQKRKCDTILELNKLFGNRFTLENYKRIKRIYFYIRRKDLPGEPEVRYI